MLKKVYRKGIAFGIGWAIAEILYNPKVQETFELAENLDGRPFSETQKNITKVFTVGISGLLWPWLPAHYLVKKVTERA